MPIQGTAADIIKIAMVNIFDALKNGGFKAKLIMQVHDELIIEAHESCAQEAAELLKYEMENAIQLRVPLTVDLSIGDRWYET